MSFSRARRFKYSISPEKEVARPRESDGRENIHVADLVENFRQRNLFKTAIDDFEKSPKSRKENSYKVASTPEKSTSTNASFENRVYSRQYYSPQKATKSNNNSNNSCFEVSAIAKEDIWTDWNDISKELVDIKTGCNKLQHLLTKSHKQDSFGINTTFLDDSSTKPDKISIYSNKSDIICEAERIINSTRNKLKKTVEEKVYQFRKETEEKTKSFLEDINNSNRIFLDRLQNDFDNIAEDLSEDISKICKRVRDEKRQLYQEQEKDTKCTFLWEELQESKKYIRFLENKFKELLINAKEKTEEQEELINILKAELEEEVLGGKLQDVLLKQQSSRNHIR